MGDAAAQGERPGTGTTFNVQPCRTDPICGTLKDRWKLSPATGAGVFLLLFLGGDFLAARLSGTAFPRDDLDLPFVEDFLTWVLDAFLVPMGTFLALRFYTQVENAFERLHTEGVLQAPLGEYNEFLRRLDRRYNSVGLHLTALGLAVVVVAYLTDVSHGDGVRSWSDWGMGFGAIYEKAVGLVAWYSAHLILMKVAITAWAIQRVFDWPVDVQPLHPDGCGGLRLFTEIAVTIAFFTATMGMAVVLIILTDFILRGKPPSAGPVLVVVLLETLTPLAFFTCLYRAHRVMKAAKEAMLQRLHERFQTTFHVLQDRLAEGEVAEEPAEEILRLDALHTVVRRLPVWPTNTHLVMQVLLSVALPLGLLIVQLIVENAVIPGR